MIYSMKSQQENMAQAEEQDPGSAYANEGERTAIGDHAIKTFTDNYPKNENVGEFYNVVTAEGYDEWARRVNFNEPYYIIAEVARLATESGEKQINLLDVGAGTGIIGHKLAEKSLGKPLVCTGIDAST